MGASSPGASEPTLSPLKHLSPTLKMLNTHSTCTEKRQPSISENQAVFSGTLGGYRHQGAKETTTPQPPGYNQPRQNLPKGVRVSQATLAKAFAGSQLPPNPPAPPGCARDVPLDTSYTQQINTGNQSLTSDRGGGLEPARLCSRLCQTNASPRSDSGSTRRDRQQSRAGHSITQPASGRDPPGSRLRRKGKKNYTGSSSPRQQNVIFRYGFSHYGSLMTCHCPPNMQGGERGGQNVSG